MLELPYRVGDRVQLGQTGPRLDPVQRGATGTVTWVTSFGLGGDLPWVHVGVEWDNGLVTTVIVPPDTLHTIRSKDQEETSSGQL